MNRKSEIKNSKKRLNPVDAVIAVVFLLSLAAMVYFALNLAFTDNGSKADGSGTPVEYRLTIENIDAERLGIVLDEESGTAECDFLKIGDLLYNPSGSATIGKLAAIRYEAAVGSTGKSDGEGNLIYAEYPGRINLILTVRAELPEDTLSVGGMDIRIGKQMEFHTASYYATARIVAVETEVD